MGQMLLAQANSKPFLYACVNWLVPATGIIPASSPKLTVSHGTRFPRCCSQVSYEGQRQLSYVIRPALPGPVSSRTSSAWPLDFNMNGSHGSLSTQAVDVNTWVHGDVHAQAAAESSAWVHDPSAARICVEVHISCCH